MSEDVEEKSQLLDSRPLNTSTWHQHSDLIVEYMARMQQKSRKSTAPCEEMSNAKNMPCFVSVSKLFC